MQLDIFGFTKQLFKFSKDHEIRLFEAFAGIGCQRMAFRILGIKHKSVGISEVDKFALLSYAAIHCNLLGEIKKFEPPPKEQMVAELQKKNVGYDFKLKKHTITLRNSMLEVKLIWLADKLAKNFGDISLINASDLPEIDIFTYSFPCTDLSKAGKQKGLDNTRSGLVYEVLRILAELKALMNLPKALIMENVVDLIQTKFIRQFNRIQLEIEALGYQNYTETMNAKDYGVAQNRDRVFMVSVLGDFYYEFPKLVPLEKRLKDYLEDEVDEKYYLSKKMLDYLTTNSVKNEKAGNGFKFKPSDGNGIAYAITTKEGSRMDDNFIIQKPRGYNDGGLHEISPSITSCSWQENNLLVEPKNRIRKLTPRECWRLMDILDEWFDLAAEVCSASQLYKQAGNGIVVAVMAAIVGKLVEE